MDEIEQALVQAAAAITESIRSPESHVDAVRARDDALAEELRTLLEACADCASRLLSITLTRHRVVRSEDFSGCTA